MLTLLALALSPPAHARLFEGMVSIKVGGVTVGKTFVYGTAPSQREKHVLANNLDPDQSYAMVHEGIFADDTEDEEIDEWWVGNWQNLPCYEQNIAFTLSVDPEWTEATEGATYVDRYYFEVWQAGDVVARMLREHHHQTGQPEVFKEHWAFFDSYAPPDGLGDSIYVSYVGTYSSTEEFFDDLEALAPLNDPLWLAFTQHSYTKTTASACYP